MTTVSVAQAKAKLSAILDKAEHGAEVVITRHGKPVAKVTSVPQAKKPLKSLADSGSDASLAQAERQAAAGDARGRALAVC